MPIQVYRCPEHGEFELVMAVRNDVPSFLPCPVGMPDFAEREARTGCGQCGAPSPWVPPTVSFPGGPTTGARPPILREDDDA